MLSATLSDPSDGVFVRSEAPLASSDDTDAGCWCICPMLIVSAFDGSTGATDGLYEPVTRVSGCACVRACARARARVYLCRRACARALVGVVWLSHDACCAAHHARCGRSACTLHRANCSPQCWRVGAPSACRACRSASHASSFNFPAVRGGDMRRKRAAQHGR